MDWLHWRAIVVLPCMQECSMHEMLLTCRSIGREEGKAEAAKEAGGCQLKQQGHLRRRRRQVCKGRKSKGETNHNGRGLY